jgi:CubicO group peptidase (beta-lactamase class C family)
MKTRIKLFVLGVFVWCFSGALRNNQGYQKLVTPDFERIQDGPTTDNLTSSTNGPLSISLQERISSDTVTRIDKYLKSLVNSYQIPGLAFAVVKDNKIYMAKAYGVKNLDTKEPLTIESTFHMASVSKPFSATAIMQLVEKGKMRLDDPLTKYLPYFKLDDPRYKEITIKQMLTHTSGIPDVRDYEWDKPQFDDGAAERYVRSLAHEKMIAAPGGKWQYSNMAFDILADVIAKVSGMTFEDYIKKEILDPLEMKESDFLRARVRPELRTSAHVFNLRPQVSKVYPYNRSHAPSSCLNASVVEMCNWAIANMNEGVFKGKRILHESSYKLLFEPQAKVDENQSIGLSWFLARHRGSKVVYHGGGDVGFRSYILMLPEKSLAVIAASNFDGTPISGLAFGLIDIMLGFEPPPIRTPIFMTIGKTIFNNGVQKAIEQYRDLRKSRPDTYDFGEGQLNSLGYQLMRNDRLNDAIEIFKLNVEMFPQGSNTYDSLGEAYMKAGNKELAIRNYEKSLELNPENTNAEQMLQQLRGGK